MTSPSVLEIRAIGKSFGGVHALDAIDMNLNGGQITGIIGPNGAGKSTLVNLVSGLTKADRGTISLNGFNLNRMSFEARARLGVVRTFQHPHFFGSLSVSQVVETALLAPTKRAKPSTSETLVRFGLEPVSDIAVSQLPYGLKKLVNVAIAWTLQPRILLLDEPFAGVGDNYADSFSVAVRLLASEGVAVGLIEHNIGIVLGLSDYLVVLDSGSVIFSGLPEDGKRNQAVLEAYFGRSLGRPAQ